VILCDTGPLVAAFNAADRDHGRCAEFLRENWSRLVIPSLAVTESATCSPTRSVADAPAWAESSSLTSAPPTGTTAPSAATSSVTTPAVGDGISVFALSVATSTRDSSRPMRWPGLTSQRTTVPSTTDSPSWGMTTMVTDMGGSR